MNSNKDLKREREQRSRKMRRFFTRMKKSFARGWLSFSSFMKNIYLALLLIAGVGLAAGAVLFANTFADKATAVLVAAVGAALGTAVFSFTLPAVMRTKVRENLREKEEHLSEKLERDQEIRVLRQQEEQHLDEILTLEKEKAVLQRELEKQKQMHIEVDTIRPIEKVSLIEVNSMITDVLMKEIESIPPEGVRKGVGREYLGILDTRFKANLGVDLNKVGLRIDSDGKIVISGITSEFQGFYIENEDWKLYEIREKKWGGLLPSGENKRILTGNERLAELTIEQRNSLMDRLSMGVDFSYLDESIRKITMEYLTVLLSPLGRKVIFEDEEDQSTLQLGDFLELHNSQVEKQMQNLQRRLAEVEQKLIEESGEARA
ncbi:MAG: hypothetical protein PVI99_05990 [Anaerolineales bacterium]|jgi:hypothetical protein